MGFFPDISVLSYDALSDVFWLWYNVIVLDFYKIA